MNINDISKSLPPSVQDLGGIALQIIKEGATPFRSVSIAGFSALALFDIGWNIRRAVQMEGRFKAVPSLKIISSAGELVGEIGKALVLLAQRVPDIVKALTIASTTLGIASIALQVFGLAANIWESVSIRRQIDEFNELRKFQPANALMSLRSKWGERKIFRIINKKQSRLIKSILQKEDANSAKVNLSAKTVKKLTRTARILQIAKTAINILMVVGLILLLVTPTPASPFILAGLMLCMGLSFGTMVASFAAGKICTKSLEKLNS